MFNVCTTQKILENILLNDTSTWCQIICDVRKIYIKVEDVEDLTDADSIINQASARYDISVLDKTDFIDSVIQDPSKVLQNPESVYILDIKVEEAAAMQKDYGVICMSAKRLDNQILTSLSTEMTYEEGETNPNTCNWKHILQDFKDIPSNSLIICDRYVFKNSWLKDNGQGQKTDCGDSALDNIHDILDTLLPQTFTGTYHVLLLTDENNVVKHDRITTWANSLIKKQRLRKYPIDFEVLTFRGGGKNYHEKFHNRRIFSNYYVIRADHKINAFRQNRSTCTQTVTGDVLYSKGLGTSHSTPPKKDLDTFLKILQDAVSYYKLNTGNNHEYDYGCNGLSTKEGKDPKINISDFRNRLVINISNT